MEELRFAMQEADFIYGLNRLNVAVRTALADPELTETLKSRGARPVAGTPQDFAQHIVESTKKWAVVVKASGARID